jgi:hypothetical protein
MAEIDKHTEFIKAAMAAKAQNQNSFFGFLHKLYDVIVNMDEVTMAVSLWIAVIAAYYGYTLYYNHFVLPQYFKPKTYDPAIFEIPTHDERGNRINPYGFCRGDPRHRMPVIDLEEIETIPSDDSWKKDHIAEVFMMREANWDREVYRKLADDYYRVKYEDYLIRTQNWGLD